MKNLYPEFDPNLEPKEAAPKSRATPAPVLAIIKLKELGEHALQENGDWLLIHRDRSLEVILP
jgi:hypothetical protein